jgi:hypothetical protein
MKRGPRLKRAIAIRDHVLRLIRLGGMVVRDQRGTYATCRCGGCEFIFYTPFSRWISNHRRYQAALEGRPVLPYRLMVYVDDGMPTLCLDWDDAGRAELVCWASGDWQHEVLSLTGLNLPRNRPWYARRRGIRDNC